VFFYDICGDIIQFVVSIDCLVCFFHYFRAMEGIFVDRNYNFSYHLFMDYYYLIKELTGYIESNIKSNLTIETISRHFHVSRFHLQRLFKAYTGEALIHYVRKRKLSEAAVLLKKKRTTILDVAIEFDFHSHEAFTRAFKSQYGITPDEYRSSIGLICEFLPVDILSRRMLMLNSRYLIDHSIEIVENKNVYGFYTTIQNSPDDFDCMLKVWDKVFHTIESEKIRLINADLHYNALIDEDDHNFFAGIETETTPYLIKMNIPQQKYAVFTHQSKTIDLKTENLEETVQSIYQYWVPKADFKLSNLDFGILIVTDEKTLKDDRVDSIVKIYLPVE